MSKGCDLESETNPLSSFPFPATPALAIRSLGLYAQPWGLSCGSSGNRTLSLLASGPVQNNQDLRGERALPPWPPSQKVRRKEVRADVLHFHREIQA